ncbi:ClpXP protease specificity-enhancing factor [Vitreoscilla massiliensis]|uniref:ClpXP protease specificity-enhancing factor n=1 Tax=Vitreoscilla massiliensis TaxID=1689272 RepID=A0ABY4E5I3_9NEIS|nr:ClpXP protease specificity-enhancing factor [Vitreoscilla massiliensis]UOO90722.1 ClpXP protease specificity-enhancing factor [Vitreoscilla massiliensis]
MTTSTKPYLVRALYEWCVDNGLTPHIAVWVNNYTQVPRQFVQDEQIVLNIGPTACKDLTIDNEWVHFEARFGGKAEDIWIPVGHVVSIFARENSSGMGFEVEAYEPDDATAGVEPEVEASLHVLKHEDSKAVSHDDEDKTPPPAGGSSFLKIVK